jgi:hypothetical protein
MFLEILVEGAATYALSSKALIERGRETTISDGTNNLTFKLNIDNVTFQKLESSTALKHIFIISDLSGPFFYENDNNTLSKGNIFINNS